MLLWDAARESRDRMNRIVRRWQHGDLAVAFTGWYEGVAEVKRQRNAARDAEALRIMAPDGEPGTTGTSISAIFCSLPPKLPFAFSRASRMGRAKKVCKSTKDSPLVLA